MDGTQFYFNDGLQPKMSAGMMFVTQTTQYFVYGGLQQIKGSLASTGMLKEHECTLPNTK